MQVLGGCEITSVTKGSLDLWFLCSSGLNMGRWSIQRAILESEPRICPCLHTQFCGLSDTRMHFCSLGVTQWVAVCYRWYNGDILHGGSYVHTGSNTYKLYVWENCLSVCVHFSKSWDGKIKITHWDWLLWSVLSQMAWFPALIRLTSKRFRVSRQTRQGDFLRHCWYS